MVKISICIPTYEMGGRATEMLVRSFNKLKEQIFKDFEVIISDNSEDDVVKNLCNQDEYKSLNIKYIRNSIKGLSPNINSAIKHASGDLIKILHMDDYLADENSLSEIVTSFTKGWLITGCGHDKGDGNIIRPHFPKYNKKIYLEKNTIGSPSVLTFKNENVMSFDDNLTWLNDCDYYKRLYDRYGEPAILNKINVIIGIGEHQTTTRLDNKFRKKERVYLRKKYKDQNIIRDTLFELYQMLKFIIG